MLTNLIDTIGKFHPVLLHLPIGILIYAYLHLGFDLYVNRKSKPVNIKFALGVGAMTAVMSAISGYLLAQNGDYDGDLLDWHKWLGGSTAVISVMLYIFYQSAIRLNWYYGFFTLFMILLMVTGHYGGTLTHGEGFLKSTAPVETEQRGITDISQAVVFDDLVMSIAKRKCLSCHNPRKKKGMLLLNTIDGWVRGGKTGQFLIPGDPENSLIMKRLHLPLNEKEHMPPSGKIQLDKEELAFLEWWIRAMNDYEDKVVDLSPPETILNFINKRLDTSTAGVLPINNEIVNRFQKDGIPIQIVSKDKPWVSIHYERGRTVRSSELNKLMKLKENVRELKLSKTDLSDKMLSTINAFTNLNTLDLSLNQITNDGVKKLKDLSNLEVLNLYGTDVDDKMLDYIEFFPKLGKLYLWQTNVKSAAIEGRALPKELKINLGQDLDVFGAAQLLAPTIESDKDIFEDTLYVKLSHVAKNAQIYYTIDETDPDLNSTIYTQPILLENSTEIKAMATMEKWEQSEIISKSFLKSSLLPLIFEITPSPNEKYKAFGDSTLVNSIKGSEQFADGQWLGFSGKDISIVLDLGKVIEINKVSFGNLQDYKSYIFKAIGSCVYTSLDGVKFEKRKEEKYPQISGPSDNLVENVIIDIPNTKTRYLQLDIYAQKKNPKWHADPGADAWLFIDEVVIE